MVTQLEGAGVQYSKPFIVRSMRQGDLEAVVSIHMTSFRKFFLTRMGPRFLRAYYQAVLDFDGSIALVACDETSGELHGFAVGFRDPQGFYALFKERRRKLLPVILLAILRDPLLVPQVLRNTRRVADQSRHRVDAVELSSIAVRTRGGGIGGLLVEAFADAARQGPACSITLTTDADDNDAVLRFYEKHGFSLERFEDRGERRLYHYVRLLG